MCRDLGFLHQSTNPEGFFSLSLSVFLSPLLAKIEDGTPPRRQMEAGGQVHPSLRID